jgi:trehalose/maltose hydrolase-like predicted phosphorylase
MYPWQSGSDGKEETQVVHLNPRSGVWEPDLSQNQRHVNAAIFYNVWHYHQATADSEFLLEQGAEMMLEIARFWASLAHFNPERERYEIHGVMGPDEFHEKYPGSEEGGLRNNAYTNVMVAWISETVLRVLDMLPDRRRDFLRRRIGLTDQEVEKWQDMSTKMFVPFHDDGIISQFEGYGDLEELDWDAYRKQYGNIQRLDRILRAAGDDPDRYKLAKQADALLLFFLFREDELRQILERLGYPYAADTLRKNLDYYDARTSHGSTLSFVAHAGVMASVDPEGSWERYMVALESDVGDVQGGTTGRRHPPWGDVRHAGPDPAFLPGRGHPRRRALPEAEPGTQPERAVATAALPGRHGPGQAGRRPGPRDGRPRQLHRVGEGRRRRRRQGHRTRRDPHLPDLNA